MEPKIKYEWQLGKQYIYPDLEHYIERDEEEPLSDKQIEALSHLMRANKPFNPTNWAMLFIGIIYMIFVFWLLLI